jgi:hypothetical protein
LLLVALIPNATCTSTGLVLSDSLARIIQSILNRKVWSQASEPKNIVIFCSFPNESTCVDEFATKRKESEASSVDYNANMSRNGIDENRAKDEPLLRCVCSWKNCRAYQKTFREAQCEMFDGCIGIKIVRDHRESMAYKKSLDRILAVQQPPEWKQGKDGSSYCKYIVARHHFTEQHLAKYDSNPRSYCFAKPFSLHGAKKYLHSVNAKECFETANKDPSEALYFQCPNVPSEVVKAEYYKSMELLKNDSKKKKNQPSKGSSVKKALTPKANSQSSGATVSTTSSHLEQLESKDKENKLLKDQLDVMQNQLAFLHNMVQKLQEQHFDSGSVYSRNSRKNSVVSNSGNRKQNGANYAKTSSKPSLIQRSRHTTWGTGSVPDEINFDEDDTESRTLVSNWNEDEFIDDDQTQLTNGTFHSRFKLTTPEEDESEEDESGEDDDDEDDEADENSYTDCMSLGASTILTASRSIKSLPRELELDEDEDDSDTHASLEEEAFESRSIASSYQRSQGSSGHQSMGTFANSKKRNSSASVVSEEENISDNSASMATFEVKSLEVTDPYGEKGTYTGSISKATGMPHGHGRLEYDEAGRWYDGDWKHGRWTGIGILSNGDGDFYNGGLKNDLKHGQGAMKFSDGRTFKGRYLKGQIVEGKMTYQDGSTYDGTWFEGMRHGTGRCAFADQSIYEGEFFEGEFHGIGRMSWNDGGWYEGNWKNGEMNGLGREVRSDGSIRHDGEWKKGQPIRIVK